VETSLERRSGAGIRETYCQGQERARQRDDADVGSDRLRSAMSTPQAAMVTSVVGFLRLRTERECRDWKGIVRSVPKFDTTAVFAAALLLGKLYDGGAHYAVRATL
jgi:hypothetical protein